MHPSDGEYGTSGHRPGGTLTDPVSPLNPYWLSQGNSVMSRSFPAESPGERSRPVFDPVHPSLSVTARCPVGSSRTDAKQKQDCFQKHTPREEVNQGMSLSWEEATFSSGFKMILWHAAVSFYQFTWSVRSCKEIENKFQSAFLMEKNSILLLSITSCYNYNTIIIIRWPRSAKHIPQSKWTKPKTPQHFREPNEKE